MNSLCASYKNEFYKLMVRKKYLVFMIIGIAICIGRVAVMWLVSAVSKGAVNFVLTNLALDMVPFFAEILIPLIIFMAATDLMGSEIQDNTMKAMLVRPVSRVKLLTSKSLAGFTVAAGYFIVIFFTCTFLEVMFGDASKMGAYVWQNLFAYIIDLVPMIVLVLMSVLINIISKSPTLSMFLCVLIYAVMKYCNYFLAVIGTSLFTSYNQWHKLWIGAVIPAGAMMSKILLILSTGVIFFTAAYYMFDKRDF